MSAVSSSRLRLALLAREHLLRAEQLDGLAVDRVVERDGPEDVLPLLLAARPQLRRRAPSNSLPSSARWTWNIMSPSTTSRPWMARPALNVLVSKSVCDGCGCQNDAEHLGVEAMRVAGLRADAVAEALPVVLGRRRDAVAVVAAANLVRRLELAQRLLHRGELRVGSDARDEAPPRCSRPCGGRSSRTGAGRSPWRPAARAGGSSSFAMAAIFARTSEPMLPSTRS